MNDRSDVIQVQPGELLALIRNLKWQNADLIALGSRDAIIRLGELAGYFDMARVQKRICKIRIVLPPAGERDEGAMLKDIAEGIRRAHRRFAGDEVRENMVQAAFDRMECTARPNFDSDGLLETVSASGELEVVLVGEASRYVFGTTPVAGAGSSIAEDTWSPNLYRLMLAAEASARTRNGYVVLEAGQSMPLRKSNRDLLLSAGDVGIVSEADEVEIDVDATLAKVGSLLSQIERGEFGAALVAVASDESLSPEQKWSLTLELQHRAGFTQQVRNMLDGAIAHLHRLQPQGYVELARIAAEVDRDDYAQWLLEQALADLRSQTELEEALRVAASMGRKPLIDRIANILEVLHPHSVVLKRQRARLLASEGEYAQAARLLANAGTDADRERSDLFELLATTITAEALEDPPRLIAELEQRTPESSARSARYEVLRALERCGRRNQALDMFFEGDFPWDAAWMVSAIRMVERSFASGDGQHDEVSKLIDLVVGEMSRNPSETWIRTAMAKLLDPAVMGLDGLAIIMHKVLELARLPLSVRPPAPAGQRARLDDPTELPRFMRIVLEALQQAGHGVVRIGDRLQSIEMLGADPDAVLNAMLAFLNGYTPSRTDPVDETMLHHFVVASAAIAPLAQEQDSDLTILRAAAVHFVVGGRPQAARNLAEQALAMAGQSPERRRQALLIFADVYARVGRQREALLCLGAALQCGGALSWDLVWYQQNLLFRLLRDVGMPEHALSLLPRAREALKALNLEEAYGHRLDTLELQAREVLHRSGRSVGETLNTLLDAATLNAAAIIERDDELLPIALMMRQLMSAAERATGAAPKASIEVFAAVLEHLPRPHRALVLASGDDPDLEDVVSMVSTIAPAEFADDTNYDLRLARVVAQRLARASVSKADPTALLYAAEILSDQGTFRGGDANGPGENASLFSAADRPFDVARGISQHGLPILVTSLDETGLVIGRVTPDSADLVAVPTQTFDPAAFARWGETFPLGYRDAEDDDFRRSIEFFGVPDLPDRAVFVAGTLTRLPPNLLTFDANAAGITKAFATTPSLGWLESSIAADRRGNGSAAAWIPVSTDLSDTSTLTLLRDDVVDVLKGAGVPLHTGPRPPSSFGRADIAILGAHGGLSDDSQYFRSVSDDRHEPADIGDLADLLRGSRVAVLFVCSGGRRDVHPESGSAVGLSRRLLGQGVSAVIAPAWPIEFFVARPWLEAFLASWRGGAQLIDAAFAANQAVQKAFSYNLRRSLAMTLYGNPFLTVDAD